MEQTACHYKNPVYKALWTLLERKTDITHKVLLYRNYQGNLVYPKLITKALLHTYHSGRRSLFLAYNDGNLVHKGVDNPWELLTAKIETPWENGLWTDKGYLQFPRERILIATYRVVGED